MVRSNAVLYAPFLLTLFSSTAKKDKNATYTARRRSKQRARLNLNKQGIGREFHRKARPFVTVIRRSVASMPRLRVWPELQSAATNPRHSFHAEGRHVLPPSVALSSWTSANHSFSSSDAQIRWIHSLDEADLTIFNLCDHFDAQSHATSVISNDSDYLYLSPSSLVSVISFYQPTFRRVTKRPWQLFHLPHLYDVADWPWKTRQDRIAAALLAGHDYLPSGVAGLGLRTIASYLDLDVSSVSN